MKNLFVGVDVSKDTLDVCTLNEAHEVVSKHQLFANDCEGIHSLIQGLSADTKWVCIENTGHYGSLLVGDLVESGVQTAVVNPLEIKRSSGIARGKSDPVDAYRIASYAVTFKHRLDNYVLPSVAIRKLKTLMAQRDLYTKILVQCKNNLKSLEVQSQSLSLKEPIKACKSAINFHTKAIAKIDLSMLELIKSEKSLKQTYERISRVIGIGPVTAIKCIVETANFKKFIDPRKFSCHSGLAPFSYQSGTSVRGKSKTSKISNKSLKGIFFKAATTAICHDPQLRAYYDRKIAEGKHKLSVRNAVANKIVLRIFAVAKREEPFVKLAA
jgi:transposase